MDTAKAEVESLLKKLPDDCSIEDIQYHLYVLEKVQKGLNRAGTEGVLDQSEVEAKLKKWITE